MPKFINNHQVKQQCHKWEFELKDLPYWGALQHIFVPLAGKMGWSFPLQQVVAPSFSSKGGKFNILDRVEEEESDLKPRDLEVWDMILEKRKKNFKGFQVFEEKEEKFQRARKWKDWNGHCVSNHSQVVYGPHKLTYTG